jgi:Zn/Cd-binding protein ZinT
MSLIQLIYFSHLVGDESVLSSIHSHAVRNNTAHTITGMLLYSNRRFLQVLEGDKKDVHKTFEHIKMDKRHDRVCLVSDEAISVKSFSHWNMGFKNLSLEELAKFPNYLPCFEDDGSLLKADPALALEMLKAFS